MSGRPFQKRNISHGQQGTNKNPSKGSSNYKRGEKGNWGGSSKFSGSSHHKLQPGSYIKGGRTYLGKREKLKERQNYASKVKSNFAKELHRSSKADGDDAFAQTPDFYKEIFAEVDREKENAKHGSRKSFSDDDLNEEADSIDEGLSKEERAESEEEASNFSSESDDDSLELPEKRQTVTVKRSIEEASLEKGILDSSTATDRNSTHKKAKPNPFKKSIDELEKQQKELEKIKKEASNKAKKAQIDMKNKKRQRKQVTSKLMRRSKTGQPILGNQISHLLSKIAKS